MSDFGSAKLKHTTRVNEIVGTRAKVNTSQKVEIEEKRDANIQANPFYKVVFNPALTPDQKTKEVAKVLSSIGTKEENREQVKQLEQIKEYLQLQRENMATKIIALTNTDTVANLQQVYNDMNQGLVEFNEALAPILAIVDAMNKVRNEGKQATLFQEIRNDRQKDESVSLKKNDIERRFKDLRETIDLLNIRNAELSEEKSFFGFGGIKKESQQMINVNNINIEKARVSMENLEKELDVLQANSTSVDDSTEYGEAKATIRKMLDLSAEGHRENQKKTVEKALAFVKTSKESLAGIKGHLTGLNGQIDNLDDANHTMTAAYAILGEGMKSAEKEIIEKRNNVAAPVEGESMIAKMERDEKIRIIDEHTTLLTASASDTELTFADLTSQSSRIRTMKDSNKNQMDKVQKMATAGVAGTADRLSVVLQAVGAAALGESSEIARETLMSMNDATNEIAMRESMRVAFASTEINSDIQKAMEDLAAYGEVTKAATEITSQSMLEARQGLEELKTIATSLQDDLKAQAAVASNAAGTIDTAGTVVVTPSGGNDPFKF